MTTSRLQENEKIIEKGLKTFVEVGNALLEIRDHQLYKELDFNDFETYCEERWGLTVDYAKKLIISAQTVNVLAETMVSEGEGEPNLTLPTTERQARELAPLRTMPRALRQTWDESVQRSPNKPPTAALIRETKQEYLNRITGYVDSYIQYMEHAVNILNTLTKHEIEDKLVPLLKEAYFKHQEAGSKILGVPDDSSLRRVK